MKLLLTSSGIKNQSIRDALVELLGKPIEESSALFVPTGIYPFRGGPGLAWEAICGRFKSQLCDLGWKSLGIFELTALPSIDKEVWVSAIQETDALLVWGGDPLYLSYWFKASGLADILPDTRAVYVGVSAGAMAATATIGETYVEPPAGDNTTLTTSEITFDGPEGEFTRLFVTAKGMGLVDFGIIPHLDNERHPDASMANAEKWAARLPAPTYAIDEHSALKVSNGAVEVVSEGSWKLFKQ